MINENVKSAVKLIACITNEIGTRAIITGLATCGSNAFFGKINSVPGRFISYMVCAFSANNISDAILRVTDPICSENVDSLFETYDQIADHASDPSDIENETESGETRSNHVIELMKTAIANSSMFNANADETKRS